MAGQSSQSVTPDYDDRHAYMAAIIATTVVAVLIAWLRMYTRIYVSRNAWWDDWVMLIATMSSEESMDSRYVMVYLGMKRIWLTAWASCAHSVPHHRYQRRTLWGLQSGPWSTYRVRSGWSTIENLHALLSPPYPPA